MALTQEVVLSFLMARGGKVRNAELVSAFTAHINCSEQEQRTRNRDVFKSFVNSVAVVKRLDGVKYVVVKKKYQEMIKEGKFSKALSSSSSSSSYTAPQSCLSSCVSHSVTSADVLNNNSCFCTNPPGCYGNRSKDLLTKQPLQSNSGQCDAGIVPVNTTNQDESLTARVLNAANNKIRKCKTGAVFAVVAIKSPPCSQPEKVKVMHSPPPKQELKPVEAGKSSPYPSHEPDLNISPGVKRRQTLVSSSPEPKRGNRVGFGAKEPSTIRLEPREHDWIVKSATGCWSQLYSLLLQDVHLVEKRNFISGFTVLHWAAKHGNSRMLRIILDVGKNLDVNIRSHDGYTPLHVAAIHSQESVLCLLVYEYGANCNIRDNSGKKAYQYLRKDLSAEMRKLLGDPAVSYQVPQHTCSDEHHLSDLSKNLNAFSKLFQSSVGCRKKPRHRSSFHLFSHEQEEDRKDSTLDQ